MEDFFTLSGIVLLFLLALALVIAAAGYAINAYQWSYYGGLRKQMRETMDMLDREFVEGQKFNRDVVIDILATLHGREWPRAEGLRWTQQGIDDAVDAPPQ